MCKWPLIPKSIENGTIMRGLSALPWPKALAVTGNGVILVAVHLLACKAPSFALGSGVRSADEKWRRARVFNGDTNVAAP